MQKNLEKSRLVMLKINKEKYGNDLNDREGSIFKQCVEIFRPLIKYIKKMNSEGLSTSEGLKSFRKLGDHIIEYVGTKASKSYVF